MTTGYERSNEYFQKKQGVSVDEDRRSIGPGGYRCRILGMLLGDMRFDKFRVDNVAADKNVQRKEGEDGRRSMYNECPNIVSIEKERIEVLKDSLLSAR